MLGDISDTLSIHYFPNIVSAMIHNHHLKTWSGFVRIAFLAA